MALIDSLIMRLGFVFRDINLLQGALIHKSYANEHATRFPQAANGERLEFLGDSVVNYLAADMVFRRFPDRSEGDLTKLRTALIKTSALAQFARDLDLSSYILVGKGERTTKAHERDPMLADMFESLLAAIYLDQGLETAHAFVAPFFEQQLALISAGAEADADDYKSQVLSLVQKRFGITPHYRIASATGPEHKRDFTAEVYKAGDLLGTGQGPSKQIAEQHAAREALQLLRGQKPNQ